MRIHSTSGFLAALVLAAALSLAQGVMADGPGPITPEAAKAMIQQQKDLLILDVRNPHEYVVAHYPNALNIPINELEARLAEIPAGRPVLVHCGIGKRSARGYEILKERRPDIKRLYYIKGEPLFN